MAELFVRPYKFGDEENIVRLHNSIFSQGRTLEQWRWQYLNAPAGKSIIYVISDGVEIIGHFAIIPLLGWYRDKEILTGKAEGGMVKKEARFLVARKQLFKKMIQHASEDAFRQGISLIWGLTNSPRDFVKGGFRHIGTVKALQKDLSFRRAIRNTIAALRSHHSESVRLPLPFASSPFRAKGKPPTLKGSFTVVSQKPLAADLDRLWEKARNRCGLTLARTNDFLGWRFLDNPFCKSEFLVAICDLTPLGYMAYSCIAQGGSKAGYILDYCVAPEHTDFTLSRLLKHTNRILRRLGADYVSCWSLDNSEHASFNAVCERYGLRRKVNVIDLIALFNTATTVMESGMLDLSNWFISMAFMEGRVG